MSEKTTLHTDCFAYNNSEDKGEQCLALNERICNNTKCSFYKIPADCDAVTKQLIKEQKETFERK